MLLAAFFHVPRQNGPLRTTEFLIVFPLATHPEQRFCRLFKEIAYLDEVIQTIFCASLQQEPCDVGDRQDLASRKRKLPACPVQTLQHFDWNSDRQD